MNFLDGSLFPENQDKLVITAAPYGPEWVPSDFPEDIPVSMADQVQKAVDCYNAGATVLHLHVRCGIEDNLWNQSRSEKMTTVQQIEQLVRMSREFGREVANGKEAREILKIGVFYDTVEETLAANGFAPNAKGRQQGWLKKAA